MNSKKYIPSIGFFILLIAFAATFSFFYWVENTVLDATQAESRAHSYFAEKKYSKAYENFFQAANLSENFDDKSRQFRCAANAAHAQNQIDKTLEMLAKALKYNKNNENAISLLKAMLNAKQITQQDIDKLGVDYK